MLERELTFLIKDIPSDLDQSISKEMIDLYIPGSVDHPKTRIRKQGDGYEFTKKTPLHEGDASQLLERTVILNEQDFECLQVVDAKRVEKTRYYYARDSYQYEIDVFSGDLEGLVLVDVEFDDDESQQAFVMPDWCLTEVTQETFIAGGMLAGKSYGDIADRLTQLGYVKQTYETG